MNETKTGNLLSQHWYPVIISKYVIIYYTYNIMYNTRKYYLNTFHILKELKDHNHNSIEDSTLYELWLLISFDRAWLVGASSMFLNDSIYAYINEYNNFYITNVCKIL